MTGINAGLKRASNDQSDGLLVSKSSYQTIARVIKRLASVLR